jgi:hypothetical protein
MPMPQTKRDNNELFIDSDRPESHMILEVRERKKHCQEAFENLKAEHQDYLNKHGRTWLRG